MGQPEKMKPQGPLLVTSVGPVMDWGGGELRCHRVRCYCGEPIGRVVGFLEGCSDLLSGFMARGAAFPLFRV